ncbi:hypothetical protein LR48_Vigan01g138600 [Vigna angularis]|uniref:Uncharacterized protein n=1 Tax=Phaseolus angularis TaxID=3914 RepID=A0A0L9TMP7_PHAAN|nr:hypothetical protein LR48_Vigan01g138600 [Vigna angularis]
MVEVWNLLLCLHFWTCAWLDLGWDLKSGRGIGTKWEAITAFGNAVKSLSALEVRFPHLEDNPRPALPDLPADDLVGAARLGGLLHPFHLNSLVTFFGDLLLGDPGCILDFQGGQLSLITLAFPSFVVEVL